MKWLLCESFIDVVGNIWSPPNAVFSLRIRVGKHEVENLRNAAGVITRESIDHWLTTHTGDFSSVLDWAASIEDGEETRDFPFATADGEEVYFNSIGKG